jgi:hypothetical protein
MAPVDTAYYDLLEVAPSATQEEISSAYKKRALRLHPDKGGNEEQFKAMKAAYDVLKDPQKRQLYDAHGPAIARAMDGEVAAVMEIALSYLRKASRMVLCALPIVAGCIFFPAIILSLKWEERISWNWAIPFIPMWATQLILIVLCLTLRSMANVPDTSAEEEDMEDRHNHEVKIQKMKRIFSLAACTLFLMMIQEGLLAARLQRSFSSSWFLVCIPYVVIELLFLHLAASYNGMVESRSGSGPMHSSVAWFLLRLLTAILAAAKADEIVSISWMLCLLPLSIGYGLRLAWSCRNHHTKTQSSPEEDPGSGPVGPCFAIASWLSVMLLAAGKMDGSHYSAFWVFAPYFFLGSLMLCCCGCLACCGPAVLQAIWMQEQEEAQNLNQQEAHGEAARLNRHTNGVYHTMQQQDEVASAA